MQEPLAAPASEAAAVAAASGVLVRLYPAQTATLDQQYVTSLAGIPECAWSITCGRSSTRSGSHGAAFTHSVIPTRHYYSILELRQRCFSGNFGTPMRVLHLRFTATS